MSEKIFTETEATDEALLLFIRKMRRMHPGQFADVWKRLPEGAMWAIEASERRADTLRDDATKSGITRKFASVDFDDDLDEE